MVPSLQVRKLGPVGQMAQVTGIMRAVVLCASFPLYRQPPEWHLAQTKPLVTIRSMKEVTREHDLVKSRQAGIFCPQPPLLPQQWRERAGVGSQHGAWLGGAA